MEHITSICVYCGSRSGHGPEHAALATTLGRSLGERGIRLIYGGGHVGLMGIIADAALAQGGAVTGVIPEHLFRAEVGHEGLSELVLVDSMHVRKQCMFELADAFVMLPGGIGTLDETFEILTWRQLGLHDQPVVVLDAQGYWQPFLDLIDHIIASGFAGEEIRRLFAVADSVEALFDILQRTPRPARPPRPDRV